MIQVPSAVHGKRLLITGGTGLYGLTALKWFPALQVASLRLMSRSIERQAALHAQFPNAAVEFVAGDIQNPEDCRGALEGIDWVIHAAAEKSVPVCEANPAEAVRVNALAADVLMEQAQLAGVERMISVSSDKAVQPSGCMGITKALMEKLMRARAANSTGTKFSAIRFGNMLDSPGSVVPLFVRLISEGKGLNVTDPEMTRFLSTPDEVLALTLSALARTETGGDIFAANTGGATILDLANGIADLMNAKPEITIVGARPGERKHETMLAAEERAIAEDLGSIFRLMPSSPPASNLPDPLTSANCHRLEGEELRSKLASLDSLMRVTA